ncbi:hypothetical protein EYF80_021556 [Liparis tanakae]|uniref:Uncharacterized protein n=1 Tax=Liparis tanakae TaxID=230148 RepID=A0A4Z2HTB1_9TELE|nr:hypothetical protein EYF80_021556 [Liparis tanakae]
MKRKPRCRGGEETGECAAELEVMVMVMARLVLSPSRYQFRINPTPLTKNPVPTWSGLPSHPEMTSC